MTSLQLTESLTRKQKKRERRMQSQQVQTSESEAQWEWQHVWKGAFERMRRDLDASTKRTQALELQVKVCVEAPRAIQLCASSSSR